MMDSDSARNINDNCASPVSAGSVSGTRQETPIRATQIDQRPEAGALPHPKLNDDKQEQSKSSKRNSDHFSPDSLSHHSNTDHSGSKDAMLESPPLQSMTSRTHPSPGWEETVNFSALPHPKLNDDGQEQSKSKKRTSDHFSPDSLSYHSNTDHSGSKDAMLESPPLQRSSFGASRMTPLTQLPPGLEKTIHFRTEVEATSKDDGFAPSGRQEQHANFATQGQDGNALLLGATQLLEYPQQDPEESPEGLSNDIVTSKSKYTEKKPTLEDIYKIKKLSGCSWIIFALVLFIEGNKEMIEVAGKTEELAEKKVSEYFANNDPQHDITLQDFVSYIDKAKIIASQIHWKCLENALKDKLELSKHDMFENIFIICEYFSSFWFALWMVHFDCCIKFDKGILEEKEQLEEDINKLEKEIVYKLEKEIVDIEKVKEYNKYSYFEKKKLLFSFASSLTCKQCVEVFSELSLSEFTDINDEWKSYVKSICLTPAKTRVYLGHFCTSCYLKNVSCFGGKVNFKSNRGTLSWPARIDDCNVSVTSSHNNPNPKIAKKLKKNGDFMIKLNEKCMVEGRNACVINGGYSENIGSEILLVKTIEAKIVSLLSKNPMDFLFHQWCKYGFPNKLHFTGKLRLIEDIKIGSVVYLLGQTSGLLEGQVVRKNVTFCSSKGEVSLKNQVEVQWNSSTEPFSKKGDSGAPVFVINKETGEITALGMLTGANDPNKVSFVSPIESILELMFSKSNSCYCKGCLSNFELSVEKMSLNHFE